jgi:hypothetical protein
MFRAFLSVSHGLLTIRMDKNRYDLIILKIKKPVNTEFYRLLKNSDHVFSGEGGLAALIPVRGASDESMAGTSCLSFFIPSRFGEQVRPASGNKKCPAAAGPLIHLAEREGFEPPEVLPSTVFETATFNRSATSPC